MMKTNTHELMKRNNPYVEHVSSVAEALPDLPDPVAQIAAEAARHIQRNYPSITVFEADHGVSAIIKAAIEKALMQARGDRVKALHDELAQFRAAHANKPDLDCVFCGRPPHPDSYGHSYRPRAAHASEP